jgi:hypothetical protein
VPKFPVKPIRVSTILSVAVHIGQMLSLVSPAKGGEKFHNTLQYGFAEAKYSRLTT